MWSAVSFTDLKYASVAVRSNFGMGIANLTWKELCAEHGDESRRFPNAIERSRFFGSRS